MKNEIMIPLTPPGNFNLLFIKSQELATEENITDHDLQEMEDIYQALREADSINQPVHVFHTASRTP